MEVEKIVVTMLLTFLLASCFPYTFAGYRDYLDTETVIVRRGPNDQGGLFGYSAVLHSLDPSGGLSNTRYADCCIYVYLPVLLSYVIILL